MPLLFGTAGTPLSSPARDSISGIETVRKKGLDCMELEFVRGVNMKGELADEVRKTAEKEKVSLTVHAPYYVNLNASSLSVLEASQQRVLDTLKVGSWCGAQSSAVHAGYYLKDSPTIAFSHFKNCLKMLAEKARDQKYSCKLGIETMGRTASFGSLEEVLSLCEKVEGVFPCIDFSHLHARSLGGFSEKKEFEKALEKIEKAFPSWLKEAHIHASGMRFSDKGERNHLMLQDKGNSFNWKAMLEVLHEWKVEGALICESPDMEKDALLMQKYFKGL
ncbi:MAG: TIM barrel protein [Candidatus Diapherotrites archaeon]